MGFIKWLWSQYRAYKLAKAFLPKSQEEKDRECQQNYVRCIEEGLTSGQVLALMNLWVSMEGK